MRNEQKRINLQEMPAYFLRFYGVGLLLFCIPFTHRLFIVLIPASLLLVIGTAFYFHRSWSPATIGWFLFIILSSFLLEMMGISTGKVFGHYQYGPGLGWQIKGTPPLIGINWLFLVYASNGLAGRIVRNVWVKIVLAATIMICYDLIVELVAPGMQMWRLTTAYPPLPVILLPGLRPGWYSIPDLPFSGLIPATIQPVCCSLYKCCFSYV